MRTPLRLLAVVLFFLFGPITAQAALFMGNWNNSTFLSAGALSFQFDVVGMNITGSFDVDGNAFGGADPPPVTISGAIDAMGNSTFSTVVTDTTFGDLSGTVTNTGVLQALMVNIPSMFISTATVNGTFDMVNGLNATYRVNFNATGDAGGGTEGNDFALGTATATLVPEPSPVLSFAIAAGLLGTRRRRH